MRQRLPHRGCQKANASRPKIELQSLVGIDLAVLRGLRFVAERDLHIGLVERLTCHQLIRPRCLNRIDSGWDHSAPCPRADLQ